MSAPLDLTTGEPIRDDPPPPEDTPEVIEARKEHERALRLAQRNRAHEIEYSRRGRS